MLPVNVSKCTEDELRRFIKITEDAYKASGNILLGTPNEGYLIRFYGDRLLVARNELDRRIRRQSRRYL